MDAEWGMALWGGVIVGLASALLLLFHGRIFGVSSVLGGLLEGALKPEKGEVSWRLAVLAGFAVGGLLLAALRPESFDTVSVRPAAVTFLAGLLVGFGTRLGSGCTSGHGVCGIGRLSLRSLAATVLFIMAGMASVTVVRLIG